MEPSVDRDPPPLCVPPLRIVAPPGIDASLPHWFNPLNPFNGLHSEILRNHADADHSLKSPRPKSAAVRDYPAGCGRNGGAADRHPAPPKTPKAPKPKAKAQQAAAATPQSANASRGDGGKPAESGEKHSPAAEVGEKQSASTPRNRKRNHLDSPKSDPIKTKRTPARARALASGAATTSTVSARRAVRDTLRFYDAIRRNLMLEEEMKGAGKGSRPDLNAGSVMNDKGLTVNRSGKVVGPVPGVEVGDTFYFRMEICCIGMHGPIQAGIEYLTAKESKWDTPVAISVISSGGYDARDDGEELIYTGQGGKSALDNKSHEDQKLERGNLAMEGSMKHHLPVRVTRGVKDAASPSGKTYIYDGLYEVEQSWSEKGKFGFEEFKFRLRRLPGQPGLGSAVLQLSNQLKYKPATRNGLRIADLSNGKEGLPVCVVNSVDDEHSPAPFEYSTSVQYPNETSQQSEGCDCRGVCSTSQSCSCFTRNKSALAYLNSGVLVKERGLIYECGSNCKCPLSCRNRLTQRATKYRLEVFKTEDKGWGLRSWDTIAAGSFICEYTGRLVHNTDLQQQTSGYVLDLRRLPKNNPQWGDVSKFVGSQASQAGHDVTRPELIIDSSQTGNVARFINHSCSPNLLVQCVVRGHQDTRWSRVMLFAMDNIPPFRELTIDYGSELSASDLGMQFKPCLCRSEECRGKFWY